MRSRIGRVMNKSGKNYLRVSNKDKEEFPEILNRNYRPGGYGGCKTTTTTWTTLTTATTTTKTTTTWTTETTTTETTTWTTPATAWRHPNKH